MKGRKIVAGILAGFLFLTVFGLEKGTAGVCEKALLKCGVDAAMSGILSLSPLAFAVFSSACVMGYEWCLLYYLSL
jgi:hypothetical protein